MADRKQRVLCSQRQQDSGGCLRPSSPLGNTVSSTPKHGGYLSGCVAIVYVTHRNLCLIQSCNLTLIREAIVSVVADNKVLMYRYAHRLTGGQELSRYCDIILGGRRIS